VRTEFSDDRAWQAFLARLQAAEDEIAADAVADADAVMDAPADDSDDSDEDDEDGGAWPPVFAIVDPPEAARRRVLDGLSNIGALRLLCDAGVRPAPARPAEAKPASPHRLVDQQGFQEVYDGKGIWIYDAR
jgi:hypothetical protein